MSYFALSDEERREWRNHPVTLAYFTSIRQQVADLKDEIVSTMLDEAESASNHARRMAGRVDGFETAIKIMDTDR